MIVMMSTGIALMITNKITSFDLIFKVLIHWRNFTKLFICIIGSILISTPINIQLLFKKSYIINRGRDAWFYKGELMLLCRTNKISSIIHSGGLVYRNVIYFVLFPKISIAFIVH
jgi:hypothetical protein